VIVGQGNSSVMNEAVEDIGMKRFVWLWVLAVILAMTPGAAPAQGLGSFLGMAGMSAAGFESALARIEPALYVGYLDQPKGMVFDMGSLDRVIVDTVEVKQQLPLCGVYFCALATVPVRDQMGIVVRGSFLVPSNRNSLESATADILVVNHREWKSEVEWWSLGGEAHLHGFGVVSLIGGFRFDSFGVRLHDPVIAPRFPVSLPTDEADLTVKSYIPYIGLAHNRNWAKGSLNVSVIGFPFVPGNIRYAETAGLTGHRWNVTGTFDQGYFAELSAEYTGHWFGLNLGAFAKFTCLRAAANVDVEILGRGDQTNWDGTFRRRAWIVGAKLNVDFDAPF